MRAVRDDSSDNRVLVKHFLNRAGSEIVEAESADDARTKLKSFSPDVIVCDIGMPAGFQAHLGKPVSGLSLLEGIDRVLRNSLALEDEIKK